MGCLRDLSSKALMDRVKSSDHEAFALLYDRLWESMYVKAFSILRHESQAKDIVQEVWISVWERRHKIENNNIEGFLLNAVRFKVYNLFRDSKSKRVLLEEFREYYNLNRNINNVEEFVSLNETMTIIQNSIEVLPNKCREVFELSRFHGLKNKEIAQKMDISQRTVETHISNALKSLKGKVALIVFILLALF